MSAGDELVQCLYDGIFLQFLSPDGTEQTNFLIYSDMHMQMLNLSSYLSHVKYSMCSVVCKRCRKLFWSS